MLCSVHLHPSHHLTAPPPPVSLGLSVSAHPTDQGGADCPGHGALADITGDRANNRPFWRRPIR
ncbi:MAG: hypothetical protein JKP90_18190 [Desulfofustis sp. PB-SRB1]|nr:hypothetical protein [Desulfofustis sp. PB-SRB1]